MAVNRIRIIIAAIAAFGFLVIYNLRIGEVTDYT